MFNFLKQIQQNKKDIMVQNTAILNAVQKENNDDFSDVANNGNSSSACRANEAITNEVCNYQGLNLSKLAKASRCKRMAQEIKEGNDVLHVMASGLVTINDTWTEDACGWNGGPALRDLEEQHGAKWRNNKIRRSQSMHWSRRLPIYKEIEMRLKLMEESMAMLTLQQELDDFTKKGNSKKPNIIGFSKEIKNNSLNN